MSYTAPPGKRPLTRKQTIDRVITAWTEKPCMVAGGSLIQLLDTLEAIGMVKFAPDPPPFAVGDWVKSFVPPKLGRVIWVDRHSERGWLVMTTSTYAPVPAISLQKIPAPQPPWHVRWAIRHLKAFGYTITKKAE